MYLGENAEPKKRVANPPTKVWCIQKGKDNRYTNWNGVCRGCCVFCLFRKNCKLRTCFLTRKDDLCAYQCSPIEWMMGRIEEGARARTYEQRRVEFWLKKGIREGDGSWEGNAIKLLRKKYGKDFGKSKPRK